MGEIGVTVLGIAGLLALISLLPPLAERLRVPYTLLLALLGCAIGVLLTLAAADHELRRLGVVGDFLVGLGALEITADAFLTIFLPVLLFEAALALDGRALLDDLVPVLLLAVVAVFVTTAVAGLALWYASGLDLLVCLLLASIVATTDPSAVVAVFREVGAPRRLSALVEGESLLNDAAAIALFSLLLAMLAGTARPGLLAAASSFVLAFVGGLALGWLAGRLAGFVVGRLGESRTAEITFSVAVPYLTFVAGEHYLGVSGVVAVATAGLVFGEHGRVRVPSAHWSAIGAIWTQLGFWANSLIFVLAAMLVPRFLSTATLGDLALLPVLVGGALFARALVLWGLLPGLGSLGLGAHVGHAYRMVILWGGLRGAVTLALALAVFQDPTVPAEVGHTVTVLATGFVLFTLVVQGTTLRPLIRGLGLDRLGPVDRVRRLRALELSLAGIVERLGSAADAYRIDPAIAEDVESDYRRRLSRIEEQLDEERHASGDAQLAVGLATLANREGELYRAHLEEGLVAARIAGVLADQGVALVDGIKADGVEGYRRVARTLTAIGKPMRRALWLHRRLRLERPLARVLADRFDQLIVRGLVLRELRAFTRDRLRPLVGHALAVRLEGVLDERLSDNDRALEALELQFPDYGRQLGERYLRRAALRLEDEAYGRLHEEYLIGPEVHRALHGELRAKRRQLRRAPALDLGLSTKELVRRVPLFRDLDDRRLEEIVGLLRPRLAVPGERLITQGERGDLMYVIASGAVEVQLPGGPVRLGTGEVFGEIALLTRRPRTADVDALTYCQLLGLDGRAFRAFLRADPELKAYIQDVARTRLGIRR